MPGDYTESGSNSDDSHQYHYDAEQPPMSNNEFSSINQYHTSQQQIHYYNQRQHQLQHSRLMISELASQNSMYVKRNSICIFE